MLKYMDMVGKIFLNELDLIFINEKLLAIPRDVMTLHA